MKNNTGREIGAYCRGLAVLLGGGTSCEEAVLAMCDGEDNAVALLVRAHFEFSLTEAVKAAAVFPDYMVRMVRAGEDSGRLEEVLGELAVYFENTCAMEARVKSAVIQPIISLLVMCVLLLIMATQVLPVFAGVYKSLAGGMDFYLGFSVGIAWAAFALSALLAAGAAGMFFLWQRGGSTRERVLALIKKLPYASDCTYETELARFSAVLSVYVSGAVNTETAVKEAAAVVTHQGLLKKLAICQTKIDTGSSFAAAAYEAEIYTPIYGRILQSGETAGREGGTIQYIAGREWADAEEKLKRAVNGIEPLLSGVITLSVAVLLISAMLPLIGIMSSMG